MSNPTRLEGTEDIQAVDDDGGFGYQVCTLWRASVELRWVLEPCDKRMHGPLEEPFCSPLLEAMKRYDATVHREQQPIPGDEARIEDRAVSAQMRELCVDPCLGKQFWHRVHFSSPLRFSDLILNPPAE